MKSFFLPLLSSLVFAFSVNLLEAQELNYIAMADSSKVYLAQGDSTTATLWLERGVQASQTIDFSQYAPTSEDYQAFLHLYLSLGQIRSNIQKDYKGAIALFEQVYATNDKMGNFTEESQKTALNGIFRAAYYNKAPQKQIEALKKGISIANQKIAYYKKQNSPLELNRAEKDKMLHFNDGLFISFTHQLQKELLYFAKQKQAVLLAKQQTSTADYLSTLATLAKCYLIQEEFLLSLEYLQEANRLVKNTPELYHTYSNVYLIQIRAAYYYNIENFSLAIQQYKKAIKIVQKMPDNQYFTLNFLNLMLWKVYIDKRITPQY